jgi:hypothetical protein
MAIAFIVIGEQFGLARMTQQRLLIVNLKWGLVSKTLPHGNLQL